MADPATSTTTQKISLAEICGTGVLKGDPQQLVNKTIDRFLDHVKEGYKVFVASCGTDGSNGWYPGRGLGNGSAYWSSQAIDLLETRLAQTFVEPVAIFMESDRSTTLRLSWDPNVKS